MARNWLHLFVLAAVSLAAGPAPRPLPTPPGKPIDDAPAGTSTADDLARLARTDPVELLDVCRWKFKAEAHTYRATFRKQERIKGVLYPPEDIALAVREEPYAVLMVWRSGAHETLGTKTEGVLFVAGENEGKMMVWRPKARASFLRTLSLSPTDRQARESARYAVTEAGIGHVLERTYRAWAAARDRGRLHTEYLGTRPVEEVGGRVCHVVRRTNDVPAIDPFVMSEPPPDPATLPTDAVKTITLMIDAETGFQLGSELRREDGELAGAYYYRDIELNPGFTREQFTPAAFKK